MKTMIRNEHGWNVHSNEMKTLLGLPKGVKLPLQGMPPQVIQGIKVWVEPLPSTGFHRVKAECPHCAQVMSAGRLHQHKCKSKLSWADRHGGEEHPDNGGPQ